MIYPTHLFASQLAAGTRIRWTSGPDHRSERHRLSFNLGSPGRPSKEPTLLIVCSDDSGSVIGPTGADPVSNRYAEARYAFEVVARRGGPNELGAVLHFDTPTNGDVGPVRLNRAGLGDLKRALKVPTDARGMSNLGPSLLAARHLADNHPDHKVILLLLTDFQLFDQDMDQVLSDIATFPGDVHAVVLGGTQMDGLLDERVQITPVRYTDPPGTVAKAVFRGLITHRRGANPN